MEPKNPQHELWTTGTDFVCGWIKGTVTPIVLSYLNSNTTASHAWEVLAKRFGTTSALQIENLKDKLHELKKEANVSIADYLLRATNISDGIDPAHSWWTWTGVQGVSHIHNHNESSSNHLS